MLFNKKEIFFSFGGCIEVNAQNWNEDEKQIEKMKNRSLRTQKSHKIILFNTNDTCTCGFRMCRFPELKMCPV